MTRKLYGFLLRLHPSCFRKQYEEQMLWIFDESLQSRGAVSLLFDAVVSLVRQWVLRAGYWRHARPAVTDGTNALAEMLHRNSEKAFRRAWQWNMLWLVGAFGVLMISPASWLMKFQFVGLFVLSGQRISGWKGVRGQPSRLRYISLFYYRNSQAFYRAEIEARRDGLRAWVGKGRVLGRASGIHFVLLVFTMVWMINPIILNYWGLPNSGLDWDHSKYFVYGIIALGLSWRFMVAVNERAVQTIQQEIDAMDQPS